MSYLDKFGTFTRWVIFICLGVMLYNLTNVGVERVKTWAGIDTIPSLQKKLVEEESKVEQLVIANKANKEAAEKKEKVTVAQIAAVVAVTKTEQKIRTRVATVIAKQAVDIQAVHDTPNLTDDDKAQQISTIQIDNIWDSYAKLSPTTL